MDIARATLQQTLSLRFQGLSPAARVALALSLAALWMLGRRYAGIAHDASIYVVQGLRRLDPAAFENDLFFAHGAQDAYTVFPNLYAPLIDALGAGGAALAVTLAGQAAFLAAAAVLINRIAAGQARWWSLALLAVISGYYGGVGVFRLAEPFSTARTLAEPLVLAALACTLASRHYAAAVALAAATALHPLVAAPGIAAVFLWHAIARPRLLWWIPVLAALMLGLAFVRPGITLPLDPPWLAAVQERSPHLFMLLWELPDWSRLLWGLCVVWIATSFLDAPVRRLALAIAATCLAGLAASWIAVDLLGNAFAAGLQLWRAHWLLHFLAIVLVPVAVAGLWGLGNNAARAAAACVAASCCFGRDELLAAAVLVAFALVLAGSQRRRPNWMGEVTFRLGLLAILSAASVGLMFEVQFRMPSAYAMRAPGWSEYVAMVTTVGGLLPIAIFLWLAACSRFVLVAAGLSAATFALSVAAWDARKPWPRFIEAASAAPNPFRSALPPGAQVFWPGSYGRTWLVLGKPTWFADDQGAGIVFHRDTAIEYAGRKRAVLDLQSAMENCAVAAQSACRIDARPARELCARQDGPDYLVLNARIDGYDALEWTLPPEAGLGSQSLLLYACRAFATKEKGRH